MTSVTVTGATGTHIVQSIQVTSLQTQLTAQMAANNISALFGQGYGQADISNGVMPSTPIVGSIGDANDSDVGTKTVLLIPSNVQAVTINNLNNTTISNTSASVNQTVISGIGNLTFTDSGDATQIFTGGGTNAITFSTSSFNASFVGDGTNTLDVNAQVGTTSIFGTAASTDTIIGSASVTGGITYTSAAGSRVFINPGAANVTVLGASGAGVETVFGGSFTNDFTGRLTVRDGSGYFQGGTAGANMIGSSTIGSTTLIGGGNGDLITSNGVNDILVAASGSATLDGSRSSGGDFLFASSNGSSLQYGGISQGDTFYTNNSTVTGAGFTGSFFDLHTAPNATFQNLNTTVSNTVAVGFSGSGANYASIGDFISGVDKIVLKTAVVGSTYTLSTGTLERSSGTISYTNLTTSNGSVITFYNAGPTSSDIIKI